MSKHLKHNSVENNIDIAALWMEANYLKSLK